MSATRKTHARGRNAVALARAARYLARLSATDPRALASASRELGAAALDREFSERSPLPYLPVEQLRRLLTREVVIPPGRHFETGNQDVPGLVFLVSLAAWLDASEIFEIGTYNGLTAYCLARNQPAATVHTLDLPAEQEARLPLYEGDEQHIRAYGRRVYAEYSVTDRVRQLEADSATFDFSPYERRCQLVYVDGAHSTEYVLSDTENARRMLTERGAIVWDDYSRGMAGVAAALDSLAGRLQLHRVPDTRLVVHFTPAAAAELEAGGA